MTTTAQAMEFTVDPWDPGYGAALDQEALGELDGSSARLDLGVEVPAEDWRAVTPARGAAAPGVLLIADGVRRVDARVWTRRHEGDPPAPGIAASYAAGIVRCVPGTPATLAAAEVRRSVFSASPYAQDIATAAATYQASRHDADATVEELSLALQRSLTQLEVDLAIRYRAEAGDEGLLLVDGPLRGRTHLPRTVGYIKTHHTAYLPAPQSAVVPSLLPGQRTPVFLMGTSWSRHAWYVRLPVRSATPWAGSCAARRVPTCSPTRSSRWPTRSPSRCRRSPGSTTRTRAPRRTSSRSAVSRSCCATAWATRGCSTAPCASPPPARAGCRTNGRRYRPDALLHVIREDPPFLIV